MGLLEQKTISNIADFESAVSTNLPADRQVPCYMGNLLNTSKRVDVFELGCNITSII
jgi:hypothetical protein